MIICNTMEPAGPWVEEDEEEEMQRLFHTEKMNDR